MISIIIGVILFVGIVLVLVVLAQNSKGGVGSQFGGGSSNQVMGVKRTTDLLEKLTWGGAILLLALSVVVNMLMTEPVVDTNQEGAEQDAPIVNPKIDAESIEPASTEEIPTAPAPGQDGE